MWLPAQAAPGYVVTAHLEHTQSPIPENGVIIDRITSGGEVLYDGRKFLAECDAQVTALAEDAVLAAEEY
jgi:hypothetical protein